jgi:nucleoside 2-deoxyribosyltransferase
MNIYVAGTVLREKLDESLAKKLRTLYIGIEEAAKQSGHCVQLPFPDSTLDGMSKKQFETEIQNRIRDADSIISVMDPPNTAVAVEAHFAAEEGKPQAILVSHLNATSLPDRLADISRYIIGETNLADVIADLDRAVISKTSEKNRKEPPMLMG